MRIIGEWLPCLDGIIRPVVRISARAGDGRLEDDPFLVDSGADRTVICATLLQRLQVPHQDPIGTGLISVGGLAAHVEVDTSLGLAADDGTLARISGRFAALTDP